MKLYENKMQSCNLWDNISASDHPLETNPYFASVIIGKICTFSDGNFIAVIHQKSFYFLYVKPD